MPFSVFDPYAVAEVRGREKDWKAWIGDMGETRRGALCVKSTIWGTYTSIFSPVLADAILAVWAPAAPAAILDPFAGGGTRAFMACRLGYDYTGIELRPAEVGRIDRRAAELKLHPTIYRGDACTVIFELSAECMDFIYTCPPYYNLERYGGGKADLSMARTYEDFLCRLRRVMVGCYRALRRTGRAVWVVGNFRTGRGRNRLVDFRGDLIRAGLDCGFALDEIAVLKRKPGSAARRMGLSLRRRRLVRVHEYVVVFQRE